MSDSCVTVGVDIGTTSVKAVAAAADGSVVATSRIPHRVLTPAPGILEHDAVAAWREGVLEAATDVAEEAAEAGHRVVAANVAAMVPSLCAVDAEGVPISPGLLYGDERARSGPAAAAHPPRRGLAPSEDGELVRMAAWLSGAHPGAAGYWPAQAVANAALCGQGAIDSVTAMTAVPLFDFTGWDPQVCVRAGVTPGHLPPVCPGAEPAGTVRGTDSPLDGAVLGAGTIDAFAEQIVAGADRAGDVLVIVGATLICWAAVPGWREAPGLWTVPHTTPGLCLVGGPSNAGGLTRDWASGVLAADDGRAVEPADVPVLAPHLRGERVPLHDPGRRGAVEGLSLSQGSSAVWRAVHEASGFSVRRMLELAGLLGGGSAGDGERSRRIVATGGGSADRRWMQALADATGLPVDCVAEPRGAALGSAWVARQAAGLESDTGAARRWSRVGHRLEPDPRWEEHCERRYRRFVELSGPPHDPGARP